MPHRTATLLPAVVLGALAVSALTLVPSYRAHAEECLTAPKGATPAGGHWRYRVERGTKRQCWYLAEKPTTAATGGETASADAAAQPSRAAANPAKPRAFKDARAELITEPQPSDPPPDSVWPAPEPSSSLPANAAPTMTPPPSATAGLAATTPPADSSWTLASRWSDNGTAPSAAPALDAVPVDSATSVEDTAAAPASATIANTAAPSSFAPWTLLAGLGAALALAGLIVRLVVRFAAARPIIDREEGLHSRPIFDVETPEMPTPPWLAAPRAAPAPRPSDTNASGTEPPPLHWIRVARERSRTDLDSDAVEELLAKVSPRPASVAFRRG